MSDPPLNEEALGAWLGANLPGFEPPFRLTKFPSASMDPFGGSGTTMIAAEKTGRVARLIELDPKYVDVIVRRWQDWTGKQATRESEGVAFDAQSVSSSSEISQ